MNKRNCECCHGQYSTGKEYGNYWCEIPVIIQDDEGNRIMEKPKGLCEFCNPKCETWYVSSKECHSKIALQDK